MSLLAFLDDASLAATARTTWSERIKASVDMSWCYGWEECYAVRGGGKGGGVFLLERCASSGVRNAMRRTRRDSVIVGRATPSYTARGRALLAAGCVEIRSAAIMAGG
jgi:hypothetical protein